MTGSTVSGPQPEHQLSGRSPERSDVASQALADPEALLFHRVRAGSGREHDPIIVVLTERHGRYVEVHAGRASELYRAGRLDIEDWEVNQKIHSKIQGFQAADIHGAFLSVDDDVNHNYNVVIDNILKYRTFVNDESLLKNRVKDTITTITVNETVSES